MSSPETLSQPDFDARLADGQLAMTIVAMSNMGKTWQAIRLARDANFKRVSIDDRIEVGLRPYLREAGLGAGIGNVAKWTGQPYEQQFAANQKIYLDLETTEMREINHQLGKPPLDGNVVIDTTGSVVHIDEEVRREIGRHSTVVYLEASPEMQQEMFRKFIEEPKPVMWAGFYNPRQGETNEQTLARSYPELLAHRSALYSEMSHVTIQQDVLRSLASAADFLECVRDGLPSGYLYSSSYKSS